MLREKGRRVFALFFARRNPFPSHADMYEKKGKEKNMGVLIFESGEKGFIIRKNGVSPSLADIGF